MSLDIEEHPPREFCVVPPASNNVTVNPLLTRRAATIAPEEPAPTTIKSLEEMVVG